jgi:AcrR family transcriptional regulator
VTDPSVIPVEPAQQAPGARSAGLHTRAGNAMTRTRDGLLDGALLAIERDGLRGLTMSAVAERAGSAKATLYNHFRTKDDLLRALLDREVARIVEDATAVAGREGKRAGLAYAASAVGGHPAVRRIADTEPAAVLPLLAVTADGTPWESARAGLCGLLDAVPGSVVVDVALRWVVSQVPAPQPPQELDRAARALVRIDDA